MIKKELLVIGKYFILDRSRVRGLDGSGHIARLEKCESGSDQIWMSHLKSKRLFITRKDYILREATTHELERVLSIEELQAIKKYEELKRQTEIDNAIKKKQDEVVRQSELMRLAEERVREERAAKESLRINAKFSMA